MITTDVIKQESELQFLAKLLERIRGYSCGEHEQLRKMILNRLKRETGLIYQKEVK